jgi:hypothetical protein
MTAATSAQQRDTHAASANIGKKSVARIKGDAGARRWGRCHLDPPLKLRG